MLATVVGAWAEHKQDRQLLKITEEMNNAHVTVFRGNGTKSEILVKELVVGDIISIQ